MILEGAGRDFRILRRVVCDLRRPSSDPRRMLSGPGILALPPSDLLAAARGDTAPDPIPPSTIPLSYDAALVVLEAFPVVLGALSVI